MSNGRHPASGGHSIGLKAAIATHYPETAVGHGRIKVSTYEPHEVKGGLLGDPDGPRVRNSANVG